VRFYVDLIALILIFIGLFLIHPGLAVTAAGIFFAAVAANL